MILANLARDIEPERSLQSIAQLVRAHDAAGSVQLTVLADTPAQLTGVLNAAASIAPDVSGRRRIEALARAFDRPRAWVLGFDQNPGGVADGLLELLENVRKVVPPDRSLFLPLVVLGHRSKGRRGADLSVGFPIDSLFGSDSMSEQRLWTVYLHWRITWFAGGRPGWAEELGRSLTASLREGDDETFERRLGEVARRIWHDMPPDRQTTTLEWLGTWPNSSVTLTRDLVDAEILWHPAHDGERGLQLTPWIARALLRRQPQPLGRSYLRGCDACEPLAVAMLARSLHLEAVLKSRVDKLRGGITDAQAMVVNPNLSGQRMAHGDRQLVPGSSAARADQLFDFAGLNDVLGFTSDPLLRKLGTLLRDVRNAIAHGHPPSWKALATIADLWRRLVP